MNSVLNRIVAWNRERNNLEFDGNLETQMLSEEANEFYMAETFVDQVDAYCDFQFVAVGTLAKFNASKLNEASELSYVKENADFIISYMNRNSEAMYDILQTEWDIFQLYQSLDQFLNTCLEIVLNANEAKGKIKNAEGKIQKGAAYVPPESSIKELLDSYFTASRGELN